MRNTTNSILLIALSVLGLTFVTNATAQDADANKESKIRIGTYDSRALAMAYYRSVQFDDELKAMHSELKKAQKNGDAKRVAELEAAGPELQEIVHAQGFGTAPVDNILAKIKPKLPGIAKEANVDIIVSKWNITYQRDNLEFIDVSNLMVKPFSPDESTLKVISEIMAQPPQPTTDMLAEKIRDLLGGK